MMNLLHKLVRLSLALLITISVIGCSQQDNSTGFNKTPARILQVFNWNNYIAPETIQRFEASCDCQVKQDYFSDNEEMLAKLAAGASGYDLIVPTGNAMDTLIRQGVLIPLDKMLLPNIAQLSVTKLPPGGYRIKIYATAADAPDAWIGPTEARFVGGLGKIFLRLE